MVKAETNNREPGKKDRNRALLEKYLNDPDKKSTYQEEGRVYDFIDYEKGLPDEYRVGEVRFFINSNGDVEVYRSVRKFQKFLCVNGPLAGQKIIEGSSEEYILYNCASFNRGSRDKKIPKAVLVHRSVFGI